ncbi:MAG: RES domain-containing protein [Gammaproteobacteria bacterium]|nr:MAG: RES domain-containing protein [Gammaproteobacteria bacterium]
MNFYPSIFRLFSRKRRLIELVRIVEYQAALSSYRATQNEEHALQLELLIETTKPKNLLAAWHPLIATPFRYNPPHPQARFRPPYGKNIFYGAFIEETSLYEHAFHFMKQRMHLNIKTETGIRTLFFVDADNTQSIQIKNATNCTAIMDKNDYTASHQFVLSNPKATFIIYPSCRDPYQRENAAILNIHYLGKNPKWESSIKFFYDNVKKQITWLDYQLHIQWNQVV